MRDLCLNNGNFSETGHIVHKNSLDKKSVDHLI